MSDKIKAFLEKAKTFLKKVPKKIYILLAVLLVVALGVAIWLNSRPYEVLFTDLNSGDISSIITYLDENGISDYKVQGNDTILVPKNQEANLKMRLLKEGYPKSGFAYTYSGSTGPFSTESERSSAELKDLQDRLSAVVRCFDDVKDAVVSITPGEDRKYVLDSENAIDATASVLLSMKDGKKLDDSSVESIRNLLAHSVKGLKIGAVSISDTAGNLYNVGDGVTDAESSALKLQLEAEWENKIRANVLQVLTPYYGEKNIKVGVNCVVDVSQTVEDTTDVFLPDWAADGSTGGRGIIGSRIYNYVFVRGDKETTGGTAGTSSNSDLPEYVEDLPELNGDEKEVQSNGQVDYDNSRSEKHIVRTAGYLSDCSISVSINSEVSGEINKAEIEQHIARAAGIKGVVDEVSGKERFGDKISVVSMPFYEEPVSPILPPESPIKMWMIYAAGGGLLFLIIAIVVIVVVVKRRKAKRLKKKREREAEMLRAAQEKRRMTAEALAAKQKEEADVMNLKTERSMELRRDVRQFAEDNPEIAAQMIRNWLRGEEDDG